MKDLFRLVKRFVAPYKRFLFGALALNILAGLLNVVSFSFLIPILNILFQKEAPEVYEFMAWDFSDGATIKEVVANNFNYYMTSFIESHGPVSTLVIIGLVFIVLTLFKTAGYFGSSAVIIPLRTGIVKDIRMALYQKIVNLPLSFFSEERKGDIIARMSGDVNEVENSVASSLDMLIKNPIFITIYFSTLLFISWQLTLFTILVIPLMAWVMGLIGRKLKRKSLAAQEKWSETMTQVEETLGGLRIIKAFVAEKKMIGRFEICTDAYRRLINKVATRQALGHPVSEFLGTVMIVIVLWFGGALIWSDNAPISASSFIFYLTILYSVLDPLKQFSRAVYNIPKGMASMERIDKILYAENKIEEVINPVSLNGFKDSIHFKNITFSYDTKREVLKDIDITVCKGKTIALVGQSGSGKSTLVDLLPRYHDVQHGEVLVDGINIKNVRVHELRGLIGNVNQEAILFNDTFFNNITFGVESATMEEVVEAARIANAHDFIMETEQGYETNIGDRGCKLSGGQRQRISIARAILKNPPILILDEATSALDTESERLVQEALERLMKTRTTIAIAHRLSTIRNADEIFVLHEGRVVERGKHEELLELNGYYRRLHDMQSL
ncbi:ABC transporter ATP-binding protein/permease [Bacteroides sp. OttesenSCG-928-D19]|nr:ABC transporter ATP-binding protein/permease [Bacteroides sp. OttesenSCG-928-N06]MDL2306233.1 ABC transporter ATP-binding protein/permease [Bacteroides sp. OttesenSCG-928-D19]